ncbi:hypothetical protein ACOSQ3_004826 [Xanthoceras sorbifolium]
MDQRVEKLEAEVTTLSGGQQQILEKITEPFDKLNSQPSIPVANLDRIEAEHSTDFSDGLHAQFGPTQFQDFFGDLTKLLQLGIPHNVISPQEERVPPQFASLKCLSSSHSHSRRRTVTSRAAQLHPPHLATARRHLTTARHRLAAAPHLATSPISPLLIFVSPSPSLRYCSSSSPCRLFVFHLCGGDLRVRGGAATAGDGAEDGAKDI